MLRVPSFGPAPDHPVYSVVQISKSSAGNDMSMIHGPSSYDRIELVNQVHCLGRSIVMDNLPDFCQKRFYTFPAGLYQEFTGVFPDILS